MTQPNWFKPESGLVLPGQAEIADPEHRGVEPPAFYPKQHPASVLMITIDSCRYDVFEPADAPNFRSVGKLYRAMAPAHFTYPSHLSMFCGFTPGCAELAEPYINPKYAKIFKLIGPGVAGKAADFLTLAGRNIIDGLKRQGYLAIGTGGVGWFRPDTPSGRSLSVDFDYFFWGGRTWALPAQLAFLHRHLLNPQRPVFAFLNIGETHVPYYHEDCGWNPKDNPCVPFGQANDAAECRRRQTLCLQYTDRLAGPLIKAFADSTTVVCADHGDCWGEGGLWEHSVFHPKVFEVPMLFKLGQRPL